MANHTFQVINAVRVKRLQLNYSQEYLAQLIGITQNAYCKIELGYTRLTLMQLFQICDALDIAVEEVLNTRLKAA